MTGESLLSLISLSVTLLLGVLVFVTHWRANKTSEKKLTVEEQVVENASEDRIAERRLKELNRLYLRVETLEKTMEGLLKRDRERQKTMAIQILDLERALGALTSLRALIIAFIQRVERAWDEGHSTPPTLTADERELLEVTIPKIQVTKLQARRGGEKR